MDNFFLKGPFLKWRSTGMLVIFNQPEIYGKEMKLNNSTEKHILDHFSL